VSPYRYGDIFIALYLRNAEGIIELNWIGLIMSEKCKYKMIGDFGRHRQCEFKAKLDGYCMIHHPDKFKGRKEKGDLEYIRKRGIQEMPFVKLQQLTLALQQIKASKSIKQIHSIATAALMFKGQE
jgi:hypothetical protein